MSFKPGKGIKGGYATEPHDMRIPETPEEVENYLKILDNYFPENEETDSEE